MSRRLLGYLARGKLKLETKAAHGLSQIDRRTIVIFGQLSARQCSTFCRYAQPPVFILTRRRHSLLSTCKAGEPGPTQPSGNDQHDEDQRTNSQLVPEHGVQCPLSSK